MQRIRGWESGPKADFSRRTVLRLCGYALPALAIPALLTGCAPRPADAADNILRVSQTADPATMDPHKQGDIVSMNVLINIFDTLTTRGGDATLRPGLALSWKAISPTVWRFELRRDVTFHNGEPFNAEAVRFSIERLLNPATESPIVELRYVVAAKVVDQYTVDLHTSKHDPILPAKLSLFGGVVVPPGYLNEVGDDGFAAHPVGTGPFTFESWQRDHQLRLRAYDRHWLGRPQVDELVFLPTPNPSSALAALESGEVDIVTGLTPDAALQLTGYPGVRINSHPGIRTSYLSLDTLTEGPLRDRRVRQALNHAVDVPLLIKEVLGGKASEVPAMIPRGVFGFDEAAEPFERSLDKARALLTEAGYPNGISITLSASNVDAFVAEAISGLLGRAGVKVRVNLLDPGTFSERRTSDNRAALGEMYLASSGVWTLDGASMLQSIVRSDRRQSRWNDRRADELVDKEESSVEPDARTRAFSEMQQLIKDEAPFVPLYQTDVIYVSNSRTTWEPGLVGVLAMANAKVAVS